MNHTKKAFAFIVVLSMLIGIMSTSLIGNAAEVGTYENPYDASQKYFVYMDAYLLNTQLEAGDEDGYWYTYTTEEAGIIALENIAKDSAGLETNKYQVTIYHGQDKYVAFDENGNYTNPITTLRLKANETIKIHLTATPDENGNYNYVNIYASFIYTNGTETEPIYLKSKNGFVVYVPAGKSLTYQDGTNGGLYGSKGLEISCDNNAISNTILTLDGADYKDVDGDGKIELTLPGDPSAQIAIHPMFTITNNSTSTVRYVATLVSSSQEDMIEPGTNHFAKYYPAKDYCHTMGNNEYWYCAECDIYYKNATGTVVTDPSKLFFEAKNELTYWAAVDSDCAWEGNYEHWLCNGCNSFFTDAEGKNEVTYEELMIPTLPHTPGELCYEWVVKATADSIGWFDKVIPCSVCGYDVSREYIEYQMGDMNLDGKINISDLFELKVELSTGTGTNVIADINADDSINITDLFTIKRILQ